MGTTAPTALQSLVSTCEVVGVMRAVDAAAQTADPVRVFAAERGIPVFNETSLSALRNLIHRLRPDCVVISSFDRILPRDLLSSCPFVNVHYAPLPRFRGRATVNWAIITGEPTAAITIHVLDQELDAGNVLFQRSVPIGRSDTVGDLYDRLNDLQLHHLGGTVVGFLNGDHGQPQSAEAATYGCTRLPADGEIDWTAGTAAIDALIRALAAPYPGAFTYYEGRRMVVWRASGIDDPPVYAGRVPGRIVYVSRDQGHVDVLTADGVLRIFDVEDESGCRVPAAHVVRSVRATLGLRTADLMSRIEALEREVGALRNQLMLTGDKHAHV
jgi:methionyl-tRNA formyltransferase